MKKLIVQLIKFGIVGVIATVIDFGALILLKELVNMNVLWASALAFGASVIVNYILSMLFVFESKGESKVKEFTVFFLLSVGGLLLTELGMWLGVRMNIHYVLVKIFVSVFVLMYNFITRKIFLEKKPS